MKIEHCPAADGVLEIAKAIASDAKIIVMDEPTSSLTSKEVQSLFRIIRRLTEENRTVIYISHRMEEVFDIGNYVTVMPGRHFCRGVAHR